MFPSTPSGPIETSQPQTPAELVLPRAEPLLPHQALALVTSQSGRKSIGADPQLLASVVTALEPLIAVTAPRFATAEGATLPSEAASTLWLQNAEQEIRQYRESCGAPIAWFASKIAEQFSRDERYTLTRSKSPAPVKEEVDEDQELDTVPELAGLELLAHDLITGDDTFGADSPEEEELEEQPESSLPPTAERRREYAEGLYRSGIDTLTPRERVALELYFFDGLSLTDLGLVFSKTAPQIDQALDLIVGKVASTLTKPDRVSAGEAVGLLIERESMRLNEPHGVTLLRHWVETIPSLRIEPRLLALIVHSAEVFEGIAAPTVRPILAPLFGPGKALEIEKLPEATKGCFKAFIRPRFKGFSVPTYDPKLAILLGLPEDSQSGSATQFSLTRFNPLVRELIRAKQLSPIAPPETPLTVSYGGLSLRHPLLCDDVFMNEQAADNRLRVLKHRFPHLDAVYKEMPEYNAVCGLLELPRNSTIEAIRKELLRLNVVSPLLPSSYTPEYGKSAHFNRRYVSQDDLRSNQDELIRRRWANLDDVEEDALIATVCRVPNRLKELVERAAEALGSVAPSRHPLNYLPKEPTRYGNPTYVPNEKLRDENLTQMIGSAVIHLDNLTLEFLEKFGGPKRLSKTVGATDNLTEIANACAAKGYLPSLRPPNTPIHRSNGQLSFFLQAEVVTEPIAIQNLLALFAELEQQHGKLEPDQTLVRAISLATAGRLKVFKHGHTFRRAVDKLRREAHRS